MEFFRQLVAHYDDLKYALLEAQTYDPEHFGFPPAYYEVMETDRQRIDAFGQAFATFDFRGKVVCEAGVGHLALTLHFLPLVRKAYLIENNPALRPYLENCIRECGWQDKVELVFGDARQVELPEPVDAIIGEMMSIFAINEHQVPVFQHLRQFLKPEGRLFPERILNFVQLAHATFDEAHAHYPINFSRHLPAVLSLPVQVQAINLYHEEASGYAGQTVLTPLLSGAVNALYLRSWIEIAGGCNFTGTDSLMPPTVVRLAEPINVQAGVPVTLELAYTYGTSLDEASFRLVR